MLKTGSHAKDWILTVKMPTWEFIVRIPYRSAKSCREENTKTANQGFCQLLLLFRWGEGDQMEMDVIVVVVMVMLMLTSSNRNRNRARDAFSHYQSQRGLVVLVVCCSAAVSVGSCALLPPEDDDNMTSAFSA